jgi:hypothetical protein
MIAFIKRWLQRRSPCPPTPPPRDLTEKPGTVPGYCAEADPTYQRRGRDPMVPNVAETLARALQGRQ